MKTEIRKLLLGLALCGIKDRHNKANNISDVIRAVYDCSEHSVGYYTTEICIAPSRHANQAGEDRRVSVLDL